MRKTLLGFVVSPRKFGNSELFIKELYRRLSGEWDLKLLRLPEMDIQPCRACYQCLFGEMKCPLDDDFQFILQALLESDAYVVAVPTYLLGAVSSLKRFLDRGLSFYAHADQLWGKPAVGVAIAGIEGMEGYTRLNVDSFIKLTLGDHRGSAVVYGALPGEIFLKEGGKETALRLARALETGEREKDPSIPVCPLCGGDTFRFLPNGRVRCMLCSSSGSYGWNEKNALEIRTTAGEHPLFLTLQDVKRHAEWLRGMKGEFMARRKELKEVTQGYTQVGTWLKPKKDEK